MTAADDEELRDLRRRAYGRGGDIHDDESALARLRELEDRARPPAPPPAPSTASAASAASAAPTLADVPVDAAPDAPYALPSWADSEPEPSRPPRASLADRLRPLLSRVVAFRPRRSSVLITLGSALTVATLLTVLVVVQRVQSSPLTPQARQVARLAADPSYRVPAVFSGTPSDNSGRNHGFAEFHGMRAALIDQPSFESDQPVRCLDIYPSDEITDPDTTEFSGFLIGDCAAGAFPPTTSFSLRTEGLPAELTRAYPKRAALQFVYDAEHDEVVVFSDR